MPSRVIGPYVLQELIGTGSLGQVYRATDQRTLAPVALKLLPSGPKLGPTTTSRFLIECEALAELSHPNIVQILDAGISSGTCFLAMELIDGLNLREHFSPALPKAFAGSPSTLAATAGSGGAGELLEPLDPFQLFDMHRFAEESDTGWCNTLSLDKALSMPGMTAWRERNEPDEPAATERALTAPPAFLREPERIARIKEAVLQICGALAYVHSRGLVHRDLKPSNIIVDSERRVRLLDFGLARFLANEGEALSERGKIIGTWRYMAPEQALGEPVDGRTDLFSLGATLYELLSGRAPFDGKTPSEVAHMLIEDDPPLLWDLDPEVDKPLARVTHRLLNKDPAWRFQTAEEVADQLQE